MNFSVAVYSEVNIFINAAAAHMHTVMMLTPKRCPILLYSGQVASFQSPVAPLFLVCSDKVATRQQLKPTYSMHGVINANMFNH